MTRSETLRSGPSDGAPALLALKPGDPFAMLDDSLGWAWGYGGKQRRVGYVKANSLNA